MIVRSAVTTMSDTWRPQSEKSPSEMSASCARATSAPRPKPNSKRKPT